MGSGSDGSIPARHGCLDIAMLDALASGAALPEPPAAEHLRSCDRCRDRLKEMTGANQFLRRFKTGAPLDQKASTDLEAIRVPGYQLRGVLGHGGQGTVYRAVQSGTGRDVAVKVPLADTQSRPSARYRFEREIELTARLSHPSIVRVLGPCELMDGRVGCVMEFIDGLPFDRWAESRRAEGRGGVRRIIEAGTQVADAIAYAHQRAVLHRDIKPSNVVVSAEGRPHVLDFGLAKAIDEGVQSFATLTGAFVGTLNHAAPEQVSHGSDAIDTRTDVYALGLLLYQALTGRLPHTTDAPTAEILRQIKELPPPRPSSLAGVIDDDLDAVLLRALAKEKDRRYATAGELRDDLVAWLEGRAVHARFDSRWYVLRKAIVRHRWPVLLTAAGAAAVATTATLGLIAREQSSRARLASAVRDARTLESHWVRMAEARSNGSDNFEAGERSAWDALLEPEGVLITEGIECVAGSADTPTSPAYWALWELYVRTPVVFTAPDTGRPWVVYDSRFDALLCGNAARRELRWWDWKRQTLIKSIPVPELSELFVFCISPDARWLQFTTTDMRTFLMNLDTGHLSDIEPGVVSAGGGISSTRMATYVQTSEGGWEWRLWALDQGPPALLASHRIPSRIENSIFDTSGRYAAFVTAQGRFVVVDALTGATLLDREGDVEPRFLKVLTRGNAGEFILIGPGRQATFDATDPSAAVRIYDARDYPADGPRHLSGTAHADRFVLLSNRYRVGVGKRSDPPYLVEMLPAISAHQISLTHDGRFALGSARPSGRSLVLDLDLNVVVRLPMASSVTERGFPTIFGLGFTSDSRHLWVGAMDGTVRGVELGDEPAPLGDPLRVEGGVTTLHVDGNQLYAGTHDLGLSNAGVYRFSNGTVRPVIPAHERWIAATQVDGASRLWALTGMGRLLLSDARTGERLRETELGSHPENFTFRALARLPDRRALIAGPAEQGVVLLDEDTLEPVAPPVAMPPIRELAVSPVDPDLVAVAGDDGMITLWRYEATPTPTLRKISGFGSHAGGIFTLAFSPDGRILATGGGTPETRDVRLWDVAHGRELVSLDLFELGVMELAFSPDGKWLAVGGEVELRNPEAGGQLFLIDLHAPARCVAGNLEYHIARLTAELGRVPSQAAAWRRWAEGAKQNPHDPSRAP